MKNRHIFKSDRNRESFQRWSDHRINQLTAATSLMFAISSAALGYMLAILSDDKVRIEKVSKWPFILGVIAFLVSFTCGIVVVFNRLRAFRKTCNIILLRDQRENAQSLDRLREEADEADFLTATFFKTQFWSFVVGSSCFFLYTLGFNWERLKIVFDRLF